MELVKNPEVANVIQQAGKNIGGNIIKLGTTAAVAVYANNIFKTMAQHTIQRAQQDYCIIREVVKNR